LIRLLLDEGLPRTAATLLSQRGLDAVHVGELGMAGAADESILEYARTSDYTIVTLDADFHNLLALSGASDPSVIRLRVQRLKARDAFQLIHSIVASSDFQSYSFEDVCAPFPLSSPLSYPFI